MKYGAYCLTLAAWGLLTHLDNGLTISQVIQRMPETSEDAERQILAAVRELQDAGLLLDKAVIW